MYYVCCMVIHFIISFKISNGVPWSFNHVQGSRGGNESLFHKGPPCSSSEATAEYPSRSLLPFFVVGRTDSSMATLLYSIWGRVRPVTTTAYWTLPGVSGPTNDLPGSQLADFHVAFLCSWDGECCGDCPCTDTSQGYTWREVPRSGVCWVRVWVCLGFVPVFAGHGLASVLNWSLFCCSPPLTWCHAFPVPEY